VPTFEVTAPNGQRYQIDNAPSAEAAAAAVRKMLGGGTPQQDRVGNAFADAEQQPPTQMHKGAPGGYGAADYLKSQLPFADEITRASGGDKGVA
jgi:hypothetical protein